VDDNFGAMSGEAFAATGWRGFAAMFGADHVSPIAYNNWFTALSTNAALFAYGCGCGTFTSADGVSRTGDYAGNDPGAVFSFLFGSYFGD
jgi:NO-binding membrane sensor protein with MHYT domain